MNGKKAKLIRRVATDLEDYKTLKRGYKALKPRKLRTSINDVTMKPNSKDNYKVFIKPHKYVRKVLNWKEAQNENE